MVYNRVQNQIANKIDEAPQLSNWKDWRWQLRPSIKSVEKFEYLTGIIIEEKEKADLHKTFEQFPFSIIPYNLSLIDKSNYKHDTVFKHSLYT